MLNASDPYAWLVLMLSVTHFHLQQDSLNKRIWCWMFSCTWVHLLNVPDGSRGFVELSGMDTKTHHAQEHTVVCICGEGFTKRQEGIKPVKRCECVFVKCVLVCIFGHLRGPLSLLASVICFKIINCVALILRLISMMIILIASLFFFFQNDHLHFIIFRIFSQPGTKG